MAHSTFSSVPGRRRKRSNLLRSQRYRFLHVESLEPRQLLAAQPFTSLTVPGTAMLGQVATLDIGFSNASPTDTGFGPYVDLYLPATGHDGAGIRAGRRNHVFVGARTWARPYPPPC